ncbi:hypothetical protein HAX54_021945 [Datura stramonium]|uniref:Uncharacterized protein n=1 Tax=Datura stramonium TaxID=4076 RepID=A0ABS8UVL4_DATST|nr:hypothetical protein [Datura stramonium]
MGGDDGGLRVYGVLTMFRVFGCRRRDYEVMRNGEGWSTGFKQKRGGEMVRSRRFGGPDGQNSEGEEKVLGQVMGCLTGCELGY